VGTATKIEQGSIKFAITTSQDGDTNTGFFVATWTDYGWRFRWDMLENRNDKKSQFVFITNHFEKTYCYGYINEGEETWMNWDYDASKQSPYSFSVDESDPEHIFQGTQIYAGKLCNVYTFTNYVQEMGIEIQGKIASWNGFMMYCEMEYIYEGKNVKSIMEALAVVTSVPESAFNKSFDVTWID